MLKHKRYTIIGLVILFIFIIAGLTSLHKDTKLGDLKSIEDKVGQLMLLPSNEEPTLATVTDRSKLKDGFLMNHAKDGDRLLIYSKNQIVIIYRPSINKIAGVGSVSVDPAVMESKGTTITVLDGANKPDKTQEIINKVKSAYPEMKVVDGGESPRQDLPSTLVIDNTNSKDELLLSLAQLINGKQGVPPLGVTKSQTDMMIIVGTD